MRVRAPQSPPEPSCLPFAASANNAKQGFPRTMTLKVCQEAVQGVPVYLPPSIPSFCLRLSIAASSANRT
jgi:hypothetical protein